MAKQPAPQFSAQEAQTLVALAQNSPQPNIPQAAQASQLIQRFAAWFDYVNAAPAEEVPTRTRKSRTPPAVTVEDVTK